MGCLDDNQVVDFIDGKLDEKQRAEAEVHLSQCAECRSIVARTAESLLPTGAVESEPLPLMAPLRGLSRGDSVGRYRVLHRVGAGAMGVVYAAEDQDLRRKVALKLLRADPSQPPGVLRARLVREARAASVIRHPNVVPVHDVIELDDGSPVLVMDLLVGEPMRSKLERERKLTLEETARILAPVLSALEAAHALGVVHRDLKPDNIFLSTTDSGELDVKIVDFGVAKLTAMEGPAARSAGLTATGTMVGTPYYMSPEQAFGEKDIDARSDLWAVGVILYECLTGNRPTEAENLGQVLKLLAHMAFEPIERAAPGIQPRIAALVGRLLCERDRRIGSAAEVKRELLSIAEDAVRAPRAAQPDEPGDVPVAGTRNEALSTTASAATSLRRISSARSWWPTAFAVALAIAGTIGAFSLIGRSQPPSYASELAPSEEPSAGAPGAATSRTEPSSPIASAAVTPSASAPVRPVLVTPSRSASATPKSQSSVGTASRGDAGLVDPWRGAEPTKLMTVPPF